MKTKIVGFMLFAGIIGGVSAVSAADTVTKQVVTPKYVETKLNTKVDTTDLGNTQTMAGTYDVTGALTVPTPLLPDAE